MTQKFTLLGQPVGKGRPRFSSRGRYPVAYTPKATRDYENALKAEAIASGIKMNKGLSGLLVLAHRRIPKSWSAKKRKAMDGKRCDTKPDADNILKIVMDALEGIAWKSDQSVAWVSCEKLWSDNPRIDVIITEITDEVD